MPEFSNTEFERPAGLDVNGRIVLEVYTIIFLLSGTANILLILVIVKYKKMREDPSNVIFLQVNLLQAVYLFSTPLTLRMAAFVNEIKIPQTVLCVSFHVELNMMLGITWFQILQVCDWFLKLYHENTYLKFCRFYKFLIIFLYVLIFVGCALTVHCCFEHELLSLTTYALMVVGVLLSGIFLIIMNIVHVIKKIKLSVNARKGNIGLAVVNIFFLSWGLVLVVPIIVAIGGFITHVPAVLAFMMLLSFSSPIYNVIYLFSCDDYYNACLKQLFKCKTYEHVENETVSYSKENGVKSSFMSQSGTTECLINEEML